MARTTKSFLSTLAALAVSAGDTAAVEFLQTAERTASAMTKSAAHADDLVGDVALKFWTRHRERLEDSGITRSYVQTSVRNAWYDETSRRKRPTTFSDLPSATRNDGVQADPEPVVPAGEDTQGLAVVQEFRDGLSPEDRDVLAHLEAGATDREIASEMKQTRHWVRGSVQRIRHKAGVYFRDGVPDSHPDGS